MFGGGWCGRVVSFSLETLEAYNSSYMLIKNWLPPFFFFLFFSLLLPRGRQWFTVTRERSVVWTRFRPAAFPVCAVPSMVLVIEHFYKENNSFSTLLQIQMTIYCDKYVHMKLLLWTKWRQWLGNEIIGGNTLTKYMENMEKKVS